MFFSLICYKQHYQLSNSCCMDARDLTRSTNICTSAQKKIKKIRSSIAAGLANVKGNCTKNVNISHNEDCCFSFACQKKCMEPNDRLIAKYKSQTICSERNSLKNLLSTKSKNVHSICSISTMSCIKGLHIALRRGGMLYEISEGPLGSPSLG